MRNMLTGCSIESVVQSAGVKSDKESGSRNASCETRVQSSSERGIWSSVSDSWQVCGGMKVGVCMLPRTERANH